ncbi:MAG: hypothetical protein NC177_14265 [Ruminococcus flavefaciens]|nr:hypothetical protein [Ruminococcus flavefaciens]
MKNTVIYAPNSVDAMMIFTGSVADGSLKPVSLSLLKWKSEKERTEDFSYLTLDDIYRQISQKTDEIITVVVERPLDGVIYQCGNYGEGIWVKYGTTIGYA